MEWVKVDLGTIFILKHSICDHSTIFPHIVTLKSDVLLSLNILGYETVYSNTISLNVRPLTFPQHLSVKSPTGQPMDYFVSGMANFIDASKAHANSVPDGSLKFHNADVKAKGGFLYAETTASNMTLTFIDANGNHLYQTGVLPRKH